MDDFKPQQQTPPQEPDNLNEPSTSPDEEPETYVTPEGQPTTLGEAHAEPQAQAVVAPKQSNVKKWALSGLVVLLLAALGAVAFWQWAEAQNARAEVSSLKTSLEAAQNQAAQDTTNDDEEPITDQPVEDADLIQSEAESYLAATDKNTYVYDANNVKTEGTFALVKASMPNTGANPKTIVLEKSKDSWVVIYSIVGPVPAADQDKLSSEYGVPKTLLAN